MAEALSDALERHWAVVSCRDGAAHLFDGCYGRGGGLGDDDVDGGLERVAVLWLAC